MKKVKFNKKINLKEDNRENKKLKELKKRVHKRMIKEKIINETPYPKQKGGCNLDSSGNFGNMISQLGCMVEQGVDSIVTGANLAVSIFTLPSDLSWDLERPNEPLPSNTPIARAISNI